MRSYLAISWCLVVLFAVSACATTAERRKTGWWVAGAGVLVSSASIGATGGCVPDAQFCRTISEGNPIAFAILLGTGIATTLTGLAIVATEPAPLPPTLPPAVEHAPAATPSSSVMISPSEASTIPSDADAPPADEGAE